VEPVINADDDDLRNGPDDPDERPSRWRRFWAWVLRPLVPLANYAARSNHEVQLARATEELLREKRRRHKAEQDADAAKAKAEAFAKMHAEVIAMLAAQTAAHMAAAKRANEG
jgi:hypothetical protein